MSVQWTELLCGWQQFKVTVCPECRLGWNYDQFLFLLSAARKLCAPYSNRVTLGAGSTHCSWTVPDLKNETSTSDLYLFKLKTRHMHHRFQLSTQSKSLFTTLSGLSWQSEGVLTVHRRRKTQIPRRRETVRFKATWFMLKGGNIESKGVLNQHYFRDRTVLKSFSCPYFSFCTYVSTMLVI